MDAKVTRLLLGFVLTGIVMIISVVSFAGEKTLENGVPHVRNGRPDPADARILRAHETWRLDPETTIGIGNIVRAVTGPEGRTFLLDRGYGRVHVVTPGGELIQSWDIQGEGPGEAGQPRDLVLLPDGNLGIVDRFPGRIVRLDREGAPAGSLRPAPDPESESGFVGFYQAACRSGSLVVLRFNTFERSGDQDRVMGIVGYGPDGRPIATYQKQEYNWRYDHLRIREFQEDWIWDRWTVDSAGRIIAPVDRNSYDINVYLPDGRLDRVFSLDRPPLQRDERSRREISERKEASFRRQLRYDLKYESEECEPAVLAIRGGAGGRIWIRPSGGKTDLGPAVLMAWDVFTPTGEFLYRLDIEGKGDPAKDRFHFTGDRTLLQVVTSENDGEILIRHLELRSED